MDQINSGNSGNSGNRCSDRQLDKFYTSPAYAKQCINTLAETCGAYTQWRLVVEPSAGNGSFYDQIPCTTKVGLDIAPDTNQPGVLCQDFFDFAPGSRHGGSCAGGRVLVIGNPPFGRVSSTAIKFFNHAAAWAHVIAFIVPRTFRKVSLQNRLHPSFHLIHDEDTPTNPCCFTPKMMAKCCFQIWEKRDAVRPKVRLPTTHEHWKFLDYGPKDAQGQPTPPQGADFALRAYGGKIGEIRACDLHTLRPKSWHWIRVNTDLIDVNVLMRKMRRLDFSGSCNTARQNSMGRAELVNVYTLGTDLHPPP